MNAMGSMLFLSAVITTQADVISDNLQLPPLEKHFYLFDVISDAPVGDVMGSLTSVHVQHSFKEIGKNRYMFVVISNDTAALRALTFPAGSEVTQYPVEKTSEFLKMFGVQHAWDEDDTEECLPDTVLLAHDLQFLQPENQCLNRYELEMSEWARKFKETHSLVKPVSYAVIARYPPRIFIFNKFEENALQNVAIMGTEQVGGPGRVLITHTRIVRI